MRFLPTRSTFLTRTCYVAAGLSCSSIALWAQSPQLPTLPFNDLVLVQEIDCGVTAPEIESAPGVTAAQTILGQTARVMSNPVGSPAKYFGYRFRGGQAKPGGGFTPLLQAGKAYVLEVEYPEDSSTAPHGRSMIICNYGEAAFRGLHTGKTLGDMLTPPYVNNNPQSSNVPMSNQWEIWRSLFHLHSRFTDEKRIKGRHDPQDASTGYRAFTPTGSNPATTGFYVIICQYGNWVSSLDDPLSAGAAVKKIRLFEAPDPATYDANLRLPPAGVPRRHLFVREEMADAVANFKDPVLENRGVANPVDFFENKARQMKFLGMNTFSWDLLEFGSNQGWDNQPGGGNSWYKTAKLPTLWEEMLTMLQNYNLDVLPYYEYAGSDGPSGLGTQLRAVPLAGVGVYTLPGWTEEQRADLTDPDTLSDAKLLLDVTMTRYRKKVNFLGAWFRARTSSMPFSFSDADFARYRNENPAVFPFSRAQMKVSNSLYNPYLNWWLLKRKQFVVGLRDHLRAQGINQKAFLLYTSDATEPGRKHEMVPALIADSVAEWTAATGTSSVTPVEAVGRHRKAMLTFRSASGGEWHHADPYNDPANYTNLEGAMLSYTFNRPYTLDDTVPADQVPLGSGDDDDRLINEFRTAGGLTMVRHYALNENALDDPATVGTRDNPIVEEPLGYFVSDFERTGPFCMMGEAMAMAKGDPINIGYLSSNTFSPGFPEYRRAFNKAFLALPALPSVIRAGASNNNNVIVRDYETDGFGTYLAVVNKSLQNQTVTVTFPRESQVFDATTGTVLHNSTLSMVFTLYPCELRALQLNKSTGAMANDDSESTSEGVAVTVNVLGNDVGGTLKSTGFSAPANGTVAINGTLGVKYTPKAGFSGTDSFRYTIENGTDTDTARVTVTVASATTQPNLSSWGLTDTSIGTEDAGKSRFIGTSAEVLGFGIRKESDMGQFVWRRVTGDFQMTVKVLSVAGATDAMAGLMLRQTNDPGARMVSALFAPGGAIHLLSRNVAGGLAAGKTNANTAAVWLRLTRFGDLIKVEKSSNNSSYTEIAWRKFPGLPLSLNAGLWATGGDRYSGTRSVFQSFSLIDTNGAGVKFRQDFSSSSNISAYINTSGTPNTWADISAEGTTASPTGGVWEIDSEGALKLTSTADKSVENDAGFTRTTALESLSPGVLKTSIRVGLNQVLGTGTFGFLDWGNYTTVVDYGNLIVNANTYAVVGLKGNGTNRFKIDVGGTSGGDYVADGRLYRLTVYLSTSTTVQQYFGSDNQQHNLEPGRVTVWIDDLVAVENVVRNPVYTAAAPSHFRFRSTGGESRVYRFDDFWIENQFSAPSPPHTNTLPVAGADSRTTAEATPVTIDVLANDTDTDAGPDALRITNVVSTIGAVNWASGKIVYTPAPGFFGAGTITYTVSDGQDSALGTVNVTVTEGAGTLQSLASVQLTGGALGAAGAGDRSRVMSDGYFEVQQSGGTASSTSDVLRWDRKTVAGNFQAEFRLRELQVSGAGAAGLMIREDSSVDARMVQLGVESPAAPVARARYRTIKGAPATIGSATGPITFPRGWIRLDRFGDIIDLKTSSDGETFTTIQTISIPGLAENVEVGLWATNARMAGSGFLVRPWPIAFVSANFDSSTSVSSYIKDFDPEPGQLNDISSQPAGGTWSISTGRLKLVRGSETGTGSGIGLTRMNYIPAPARVVRMSMDLVLSGVTATSGDLLFIEFGEFPSADYRSAVQSSVHTRVALKASTAGKYVFRVSGTNQTLPAFSADGVKSIPIMIWVNDSGGAVQYRTPAGNELTLQDQRVSVWADGNMLFTDTIDNVKIKNIDNFRIQAYAPGLTALIDNLVLDEEFLPNHPPEAVTDVASTPMGTTVDIPVLSNDADGDGPSPIFITGVSNGSAGNASVVNGKVRYVPAPGFTGSDKVTYTISDGDFVDWGTIQIAVTGNPVASALNSLGLTGLNVGIGSSGNSSILSQYNNVWEIQGGGTGLAGVADSFRGEFAVVPGDFQVLVKLNTLATAGQVGLMIRDGTADGARMAAISMGFDQVPRYAVRATTGGTVVETTPGGTWSMSTTYLLLKREGNNLKASISADGANFTQVLDQVFTPALAPSMQAGLWVSGGGTAVVHSFAISRFRQTFETTGATGVYTNYMATPSLSNFFNHIGMEALGGTWSIDSFAAGNTNFRGRLKLARAVTASGTTTNGAGFTRYSVPGTTFPRAMASFKMTLSGVTTLTGSTDLAVLDLGTFTTTVDYNSSSVTSGVANRLVIQPGGAPGQFKFTNSTTSSAILPADGTTDYLVQWFLNQSGSGIVMHYTGPDGSAQDLDDNSSDLWLNGLRIMHNVPRSVGTGTEFGGIRFRVPSLDPLGITFDDWEMRSMP